MKKNIVIGIGLCLLSIVSVSAPVKSRIGSSGEEYITEDNWNPTAIDYVQDGLIRQLDSIETIGYGEGVYESGTRLKNLATGKNSGLIIDSIVSKEGDWLSSKKQVSNYVFPYDDAEEIVDAYLNNSWTLEFCGFPKTFVGAYDSTYAWKLGSFGFAGNVYFQYGTGGTIKYLSDFYIQHASISLVRDGEESLLYVNGNLIAQDEAIVSGVAPSNQGFYLYPGAILGSYRFYNKSLSEEEVNYNFEIDRRRFGL